MRKKISFCVLLCIVNTVCLCQTKNTNDTTKVLESDIYSNFSKENYTKTEARSFFITKDAKDSISVIKFSYDKLIGIGDKLYKKGDFRNAANCYRQTFIYNKDLGKIDDRFKLACCYINLGSPDSAFLQLQRIVNKGKYINLEEIIEKKCFKSLQSDKRWLEILMRINKNREELIQEMNKKVNNKDQ